MEKFTEKKRTVSALTDVQDLLDYDFQVLFIVLLDTMFKGEHNLKQSVTACAITQAALNTCSPHMAASSENVPSSMCKTCGFISSAHAQSFIRTFAFY